MGFFGKKKEATPIDMSMDAGRKKFIEEAIAKRDMEPHIPMDVVPMPLPPGDVPLPPASFVTHETPTFDYSNEETALVVTMKVNIKDKRLLIQLIDGIAEITENYGVDAIEDFKVEKCKSNIDVKSVDTQKN